MKKPSHPAVSAARALAAASVGADHPHTRREAARALTGRGISREGNYEFHPRLHDGGKKTEWEWAPVGESFHEYQKFGHLLFADR